jgi:Holliday junction resolvase RusA-like endonuclease
MPRRPPASPPNTDATIAAMRDLYSPVVPDAPALPSDFERGLRLCESLCPGTDDMRYLVIPGPPHSKARHRHTKRGHSYMPAEERNAEYATGMMLKRMTPIPFDGNLALACIFFRPNKQRIDCDNMLKHVCDAATGVLWHDDAQVTAIMGIIEYDPANPRTLVMVGQHESTLVRDRMVPLVCTYCGKTFIRKKAGQSMCSRDCQKAGQSHRNRTNGAVLDPRCQVCGADVSKQNVKRCRSCWAVRGSEVGQ